VPEVMQDMQEIRTLAREFAQSELRPHTERWDHDRSIDPSVHKQIAELGFFGMLTPEPFGGMGFDLATYAAVLEELAWGEPGVAVLVAQSANAATLIDRHGNDAQKQQWLEALASGTVMPCFAMAESEAGSDLSRIETKARQEKAGWTVSGSKAWVTNPSAAGVAFVLARADNQPRLFLVPKEAGWTVGAREHTPGLRPLEIADLVLDGVQVDQSGVLDARESQPSAPTGELGRLSIAAISVGLAQAALDHAVAYANEREQFGTKLRHFEGLQYKLADMAVRVEAARQLTQHAAERHEPLLMAMAKLFASESAMWITTQAVQIFGGYGYMRDYPVEKLMRDAKAMELLEGANELQRVYIAQGLYEGKD
jgi:alkylation response protein AidB-like acyl-CoA dehydrogenase